MRLRCRIYLRLHQHRRWHRTEPDEQYDIDFLSPNPPRIFSILLNFLSPLICFRTPRLKSSVQSTNLRGLVYHSTRYAHEMISGHRTSSKDKDRKEKAAPSRKNTPNFFIFGHLGWKSIPSTPSQLFSRSTNSYLDFLSQLIQFSSRTPFLHTCCMTLHSLLGAQPSGTAQTRALSPLHTR